MARIGVTFPVGGIGHEVVSVGTNCIDESWDRSPAIVGGDFYQVLPDMVSKVLPCHLAIWQRSASNTRAQYPSS